MNIFVQFERIYSLTVFEELFVGSRSFVERIYSLIEPIYTLLTWNIRSLHVFSKERNIRSLVLCLFLSRGSVFFASAPVVLANANIFAILSEYIWSCWANIFGLVERTFLLVTFWSQTEHVCSIFAHLSEYIWSCWANIFARTFWSHRTCLP